VFIAGALIGGIAGLYVGIKIGGLLAVRRLVEFEYRTLTGRAGLRRRD
jgi:hypothetical protein